MEMAVDGVMTTDSILGIEDSAIKIIINILSNQTLCVFSVLQVCLLC